VINPVFLPKTPKKPVVKEDLLAKVERREKTINKDNAKYAALCKLEFESNLIFLTR
jgi:hypothetical protein